MNHKTNNIFEHYDGNICTVAITEKTGKLIALKIVTDDNDLMIINRSGITIRMACKDLRVMGRATQGVRLINLKGSDSIASVAKVDSEELDESIELDEDGNPIVTAEGLEQVEASTSSDEIKDEDSTGTDVDNATEDEKED